MYFRFILTVIVCLWPALLTGQSLNLSVQSTSTSVYSLANGSVTIQSSSVRFPGGETTHDFLNFGVSPDHRLLAMLQRSHESGRGVIYTSGGIRLSGFPAGPFDEDDSSLSIYPLNSGEVMVRSNGAYFTRYDIFGVRKAELSSFLEGEVEQVMSETAMDPNGDTVIFYTPKIKQNGSLGSTVQLLGGNGELKNIFFSTDRTIRFADVTPNGKYILVVTSAGQGSRVTLYDRHGNELNSIVSDDDAFSGAAVDGDAGYLLAYSSRRAVVYEAMTGERIGSTSFSTTLVKARYFPGDETIVGLTGSYYEESGIVNNVTFHAVNLRERALARENMSGSLLLKKQIPSRFVRTGTGRYRLEGANSTVEVRASF